MVARGQPHSGTVFIARARPVIEVGHEKGLLGRLDTTFTFVCLALFALGSN